METSTTTCWPRQSLRDYLSGWIPAEQLAEIENHLESCMSCEQTLHALEAESDTLCELLRNRSEQEPAPGNNLHSQTSAAEVHTGDSPSSAIPLSDSAAAVVSYAIERAAAIQPSSYRSDLSVVPKQLGPYDLVRPLGSGGMGAVYLATHRQLRKSVAIKLLPARAFRNDHYAARFQREIRAAGQLQHPAVVSATDAGEDAAVHFLVMEYIDGLDISRVARTLGQLSIADACEIVRTVALGLAHAHARGIVHRDVKPSNIMLSRSGEVKILDFGLAQVGLWDDASAELTTVGQLMGTLDYMAPEQAEQPSAVDYRADLYSLGATLFRLLCGRAPLAAAPDMSPMTKLRLLHEHPAPSLATLRSDAPLELVQIVDGLLQRDADKRPASAAHVAESLAPFAAGANLMQLIETAKQLPTDAIEDDNNPLHGAWLNSLQAEAEQNANIDAAPTEAVSRSSSFSSRRWGLLTALAMLPLLVLCGILLTLELQKGQLIIDSTAANVQVQLLKDGQLYERVTVQPGANVTRIYAGQYEILIDEGSDQFQLEQETIAVKRGDAVVVRLTERSIASQVAGSNTQSQTQPSPNELEQSLRAAGIQPSSTASIEPGDQLEVVSQTEPLINREATVMADYTVKLPLVGVVSIQGLNPQQLETSLNEKYKSHIRTPHIEVYRTRPAGLTQKRGGFGPKVKDYATTLPNASSTSENSAAEQPVYDGKTLDEWLAVLSVERSPERVDAALAAVSALRNSATAPLIISSLRNVLPNLTHLSPKAQMTVWKVLKLCHTSRRDFWHFVIGELESDDTEVARQVVRHIPQFLKDDTERPDDLAELTLYVGWLFNALNAGPKHELYEEATQLANHMLHAPELATLRREVGLLSRLLECNQLGDSFWLAKPPHSSSGQNGRVIYAAWPSELVQQVESSALKVLGGSNSDLTLMTQAACMLQILHSPDFYRKGVEPIELTNETASNMEATIRGLVEGRRMFEPVLVPSDLYPALFEPPTYLNGLLHFNNGWAQSVESPTPALPVAELLETLVKLAPNRGNNADVVTRIIEVTWERSVSLLEFRMEPVRLHLAPSGVSLRVSKATVDGDDAWSFLLLVTALGCLDEEGVELYRTRLEEKKIEAALMRKDKDGDGRVSAEEFGADSDGDGWVSLEEFREATTKRDSAPATGRTGDVDAAAIEWARRQIAKYDTDSDGKLSEMEWERIMLKPRGADVDGDGFITVEEYAAFRLGRK